MMIFVRIYNENNLTAAAESNGQLVRHFYALGAYEHDFNPFWSIEPSVLLKGVEGCSSTS